MTFSRAAGSYRCTFAGFDLPGSFSVYIPEEPRLDRTGAEIGVSLNKRVNTGSPAWRSKPNRARWRKGEPCTRSWVDSFFVYF